MPMGAVRCAAGGTRISPFWTTDYVYVRDVLTTVDLLSGLT